MSSSFVSRNRKVRRVSLVLFKGADFESAVSNGPAALPVQTKSRPAAPQPSFRPVVPAYPMPYPTPRSLVATQVKSATAALIAKARSAEQLSLSSPSFSTHPQHASTDHRFLSHLFSERYELLFPQLFCFHKHLRCPRVSPSGTNYPRFSPSQRSLRLAVRRAGFYGLPAVAGKFRAFILLQTLCRREKPNPFAIKQIHTLSTNCPGGGIPGRLCGTTPCMQIRHAISGWEDLGLRLQTGVPRCHRLHRRYRVTGRARGGAILWREAPPHPKIKATAKPRSKAEQIAQQRDAPKAANVFTRFVIAWESDRQRWSKSAEARRACPLWPPRNCWKSTPARA
jgi:hypothetical protein